jgi:hypothetical protein
MKIEIKNDWPVDSTRFVTPSVAIRGFRRGPQTIAMAFWTWRIFIHFHNADLTGNRKGE